jgi:hypothetical protein
MWRIKWQFNFLQFDLKDSKSFFFQFDVKNWMKVFVNITKICLKYHKIMIFRSSSKAINFEKYPQTHKKLNLELNNFSWNFQK